MSDSSDDSDYVLVEGDDNEDKEKGKRQKVEEEVDLLKDEELNDIWAQMNTKNDSVVAPKALEKNVSNVAANVSGGIDISRLMAEIESSEPKLEKETVRFAGEEVQVMVHTDKAKVCETRSIHCVG
jgi:hypothetical protein